MNLKRAFSAVCAAAVLVSTTLSDLPTQFSAYSYAYAAESAFRYAFDTSPVTMTVKTKDDGTLECEYTVNFPVDGVTSGKTTVAELRGLYSGLTVSGFSFKNSTLNGLTAADIHMAISVLSGTDSGSYDGWYAVTDEDTLDFADMPADNDNKVVQNLAYHIYIDSDAIFRLKMNPGETILLNRDENAPEIAHVSYDGSEIGGRFSKNGPALNFNDRYNIILDGVDATTTVAELKEKYSGIMVDNFAIDSLSDERMPVSSLASCIVVQTGTNNTTDYSGWTSGPENSLYFDFGMFDGIPDSNYIRNIWLDLNCWEQCDKWGFKENDVTALMGWSP